MRSAPRNLSLDDFTQGARYAHERGARVYVTLNILPRNNEITAIERYIEQLRGTGVDALIVTDIGVLMMARRIAPELELHVSTQAGVTNYAAANALYELGARRVVLAREMDLQAVRDIRANIPDDLDIETFVHGSMCMAFNALYELGARRVVLAREMDLQAVRDIRANIPDDLDIETFVHGSMCMAFSGRCLISNYLTGRDGNHGECAQPCRWKYSLVEEKRPGQVFPIEETAQGTYLFNSQDMNMMEHLDDLIAQPCRWKYSLVEEKRPGQVFPIEETAQGTYLFNSQDMNMMEHLDDLIDSGATSLKIEGRSKSAYYVAAMTNAYKSAVNEYMVQRGFEDAEGNELKPFRDRVIRAGEEGMEDAGPDSITLHADEAFAGMPNWDSAVDEGELSNRQARRTGLERQAEYAEDAGWKHAAVHPAPPVELPDWLREEPGKVAHRDYSTGFYYPEQKVTQNTDRSAYFRDWLVVGEALEWTPEDGGRLTIMSRNKIEPGQLVEILLPGEAPLQYVVPAEGLRDADGEPVALINHPAHVFSLPMPVEVPVNAALRSRTVPVNAALRSRTKRPTLKAE